jgi:hypothetical protein
MLSTLDLNYIQHLERGYCENHPDVVAGTKQQVVDRAVKQLLTALQGNGFELDGNIFKRGNGWLQYDATSSKWQYSNDAGSTWADMGSGGGGGVSDHTLLTNIGVNSHAQLDSHVADATKHFTQAEIDHVNVLSRGTNTHAQIDSHIANTGIHGGGGGASPSVYVCTANRQITIEECNGSIFRANANGIVLTLPSLASYTGYGKAVLMGSTAFHIYASSGQWIDGLGGSSIIQFHNAQSWANMVLYCAGGAWFYTSKIGTWTEDYLPE